MNGWMGRRLAGWRPCLRRKLLAPPLRPPPPAPLLLPRSLPPRQCVSPTAGNECLAAVQRCTQCEAAPSSQLCRSCVAGYEPNASKTQVGAL